MDKIAMYKEQIEKKAALTKPTYKKMLIANLNPDKSNEVWSAKIDGAHTVVEMEIGKVPKHFSHRTSVKTGEKIPYTKKLLHVVTPSSHDAVVRGETYAVTSDGRAVHPDVVTALLNSGLEKSHALQKALGISTKTALIDIDSFDGHDLRNASFEVKRQKLEEIAKTNPDFIFPDTARTPLEKKALLKRILDGSHPQTREGIVVHDLKNANRPFTKAKVIDEHDVYLTGIFHEEGVKAGRKKMAGGFAYSWEPNGETVGKVGTGFNHAEKEDMGKNPHKYLGRVARVHALGVSKNKVLVKPSFSMWHVEKNLRGE